jgi:hypothetical protein
MTLLVNVPVPHGYIEPPATPPLYAADLQHPCLSYKATITESMLSD